MIVDQTRKQSGRGHELVPHLLEGDENEAIYELDGDVEELIALAESRVSGTSLKYGVRQVVVSPHEELTPEQERQMIDLVTKTMGAEGFERALVKHVKERADGTKAPHYHFLFPERNANGKALNKDHFKVKNELMARSMELEFGHELTKGKHNRTVYHALREQGQTAAAEAMKHLTEGPPALSQFSGKAHQVAKRLGVDLPKIAQTLKPGKGEGVEFHAKQIAQILRDHPNARVALDPAKGHLSLTGPDGTFIASLNRVAKIDRAQNNEILNKIRDFSTVNAAEIPADHVLPVAEKETAHVGRTSTTTRTIDAAQAAIGDTAKADASARRDQKRHDANPAAANRLSEPELGADIRPGRVASSNREAGRSSSGDPRHDERSHERVERHSRAQRADEQRDRRDQAVDSELRSQDRQDVRSHNERLVLRNLDEHRIETAYSARLPSIQTALSKAKNPLIKAYVPALVGTEKPALVALTKLQSAKFEQAWAERREAILSVVDGEKFRKPLVKAITPMPAEKPVLPPTKQLLSKLQAVRFEQKWTEKRDAIIAAAAWEPIAKVYTPKTGKIEKAVAVPVSALPPKSAAFLSTAEIRKLFAPAKEQADEAQRQFVASLLKEHGLHLGEGAKAGVITINRRLSNGSAEFLGSLDRFANLKTSDADRADVIASIMSKVNVLEAPAHQIPTAAVEEKSHGLAKQQTGRREASTEANTTGAKIWREFAAKFDARADRIAAFNRISAERADGTAYGSSADGPDFGHANANPGSPDLTAAGIADRRKEPSSADASSLQQDRRKDIEHRGADNRLPYDIERARRSDELDEIRSRSVAAAELSNSDGKQRDSEKTEETLKSIESALPALKSVLENMQHQQLANYTVPSVDLYLGKTDLKPMPSVNKAPVRQAKPKRSPMAMGGGRGPAPTSSHSATVIPQNASAAEKLRLATEGAARSAGFKV